MDSIQSFAPAIIHWSFGITLLIGVVSACFTAAEAILGILLATCTSALSAICSYPQSTQRPAANWINFFIIWLEVLSNLVAAASCAQLASAAIDFITMRYYSGFIFGREEHPLGENWPDVLGVTIVLVVTVLFMMGLERSPIIGGLLFLALLSIYACFTVIGSFYTLRKFKYLVRGLQVRSLRNVLEAAGFSSFAFVHKLPTSSKNHCATILFMPLVFYTGLAITFSLMTLSKELAGTVFPLFQVFQRRGADWTRPIFAVFTISVACLLLTEILPCIYFSFVDLAGKEWRVFVSSIQYQSRRTGAPVLAIFAAGSLVAILSFACPLLYLLEMLNVACLLKCALTSCYLMHLRYRPDILHSNLEVHPATSVQYSQLLGQSRPAAVRHQLSFMERFRSLFNKRPQYIHKLSSPKASRRLFVEEQECLLFKEPNGQSANAEIEEDSNSESEENEMEVLSGSDGESSTDIDVVVEEYKEALRVSTMGNFSQRTPSTPFTWHVMLFSLTIIVLDAVLIRFTISSILRYYKLEVLALALSVAVTACLPVNASEKSKPSLLPSVLFPLGHSLSIAINILLALVLIPEAWEGIVCWTMAGVLLYWKCNCCQCEILEPLVERVTSKLDSQYEFHSYQDSLGKAS